MRLLLTKRNINARLTNDPQVFWDNVLWPVKSKVEFSVRYGSHYVWPKANTACHNKNIISFKHGGGNVTVWGCFGVWMMACLNWENHEFCSKRAIASSATPKGLEDHGRQLQWMIAEFFPGWRKTLLQHLAKYKHSQGGRHIIVTPWK